MVSSEEKIQDLINFTNEELIAKEQSMYSILCRLIESCKTKDDPWYINQKYDCFFDVLALREWTRLKGLEVPERDLIGILEG